MHANILTAPLQSRVALFEEIYYLFLILGTLVGIVVISYTVYNAYKYRDDGEEEPDADRPSLGELPVGGKGGRKLFLSFGISAIIVISLVIWSYTVLLDVEDGPDQESIEVDVVGEGFAWQFTYENGHQSFGTLTVPADTTVWLNATSGDVWHTFGVPDLRVKVDAIPGETDRTWFIAEEPGETHTIRCFELCGPGHSQMTGTVEVVTQEEYEQFLAENDPDAESNGNGATTNGTNTTETPTNGTTANTTAEVEG